MTMLCTECRMIPNQALAGWPVILDKGYYAHKRLAALRKAGSEMRDWIQCNKIDFETLAASPLGMMSVSVACAAVYVGVVGVQANNIADYQG